MSTFAVRSRVLFLLLGLVLAAAPLLAATPLSLSVIDVGQGDSLLMQFPNGHTMLIDAGVPTAGPAVVSYLRSRHVTRIDTLVATHPHSDHMGGLPEVVAAFPVGRVWDGGFKRESQTAFYDALQAKHVPVTTPSAGFTEKIGEVTVTVLGPKTQLTGTRSDPNNNSLVLRLSYRKVSFLLPGDMEAEERASIGPLPASTVLKVAHHGSIFGTDAALLQSVQPRLALISVAAKNDYMEPHPPVLALLAKAGAQLFTTAHHGSILVTTDGATFTVKPGKAPADAPK